MWCRKVQNYCTAVYCFYIWTFLYHISQPILIFSRLRILHIERLLEVTWVHSFVFDRPAPSVQIILLNKLLDPFLTMSQSFERSTCFVETSATANWTKFEKPPHFHMMHILSKKEKKTWEKVSNDPKERRLEERAFFLDVGSAVNHWANLGQFPLFSVQWEMRCAFIGQKWCYIYVAALGGKQ